MKKVLLAPDIITLLVQQQSFLNRSDLRVFTAETNEEALDIHREEKVNLIINHFTAQEMSTERFCSVVREDKDLSRVSVIIICSKIRADIEASERCKANAIMTRPMDPAILLEKAHQLLDISSRASFRILLNVSVDGTIGNTSFFCRSENISASGMLIETDQLLAKGDIIACSFFLPAGMRIQTTAEVMRNIRQGYGSGPHQYGIRFTRLTPEAKRALADFVETRSRQTGPDSS
ncbi:MAG TPA: PilZ domain-containing protein [Nitrospirota bacterium]|nr:PilZ domain-containing protein [Nitrospirota bacterium]